MNRENALWTIVLAIGAVLILSVVVGWLSPASTRSPVIEFQVKPPAIAPTVRDASTRLLSLLVQFIESISTEE